MTIILTIILIIWATATLPTVRRVYQLTPVPIRDDTDPGWVTEG